ncbi:MAG: hypothetical protein ACI9FD_002571 [Gammaproteobacteria bacterium]|jgi:hypothetical protein
MFHRKLFAGTIMVIALCLTGTGAVAQSNINAEVVFWQSISTGTSCPEYQAYVGAFPNGLFAELAQTRIAQYCTKLSPTSPTASQSGPPPAAPTQPSVSETPEQATGKSISAVQMEFLGRFAGPLSMEMTVTGLSQTEITGKISVFHDSGESWECFGTTFKGAGSNFLYDVKLAGDCHGGGTLDLSDDTRATGKFSIRPIAMPLKKSKFKLKLFKK